MGVTMFDLRGTFRFFKESRFQQFLGDILMYYDFLDPEVFNTRGIPVILMKNGSLTAVFKIEGVDIETLSRESIRQLDLTCRSFFDIVKEKVTFSSFLLRRKIRKIEAGLNGNGPGVFHYIGQKKQAFWKELCQHAFSTEIYFSLTLHRALKGDLNFRSFLNCRDTFTVNMEQTAKLLERLVDVWNVARSVFSKVGFSRICEEEIFSFLYRLVNYDDPPPFRKDLSLHSQLTRSELEFKRDLLLLNNRVCIGAVPIIDPPVHTDLNFFLELQKLGSEFLLAQHFRFIDFRDVSNRFLLNRRIAGAMRFKSREADRCCEEFDAFQEKMEKERFRPLLYSFYMINYAQSGDELDSINHEVSTLLSSLGAYGKAEAEFLRHAFFSTLPGHDIFNTKRRFFILSGNASNLLSTYRFSLGDAQPVEIFQDRNRGIYCFNPFSKDQDACHTAITGPTGSGKTFLAIKIMLSIIHRNPFLFVIDPKKSYYPLFEILEDIYPDRTVILKYSDDGVDFTFNPFLVGDPGKGVDEFQFKFSENLLYLIVGKQNVQSQHRSLIRRALEKFYFEYCQLLKRVSEPVQPLTLLHSIFKNMKNGRSIAESLENWLKGERAQILNTGRDNVRFARFCYFDLRDLDNRDDILAVIVFLIIHKLKKVIEDESLLEELKLLCLEESSVYLKRDEFKEVVDFFIRTGRTNNLNVMLISQSIDDFFDIDLAGILQPWSNAIVNNLVNIILYGGQRNIKTAFDILQMNEEFVEKYKTLNRVRREFLLWRADGLRRILTAPTDDATYWLATTSPDERALRCRLKNECGGDYIKTIEQCIECAKGGLQ